MIRRSSLAKPIFDWGRLVRLPNAFTVVADVLAGLALARGAWEPWLLTVGLVAAGVGIYWAGMILNDIFDVDKDRLQNRGRPLVDGSIALSTARSVAYGLIFGAVVIVVACSFGHATDRTAISNSVDGWLITPFIAVLLVVCVYLYDGPLKSTFFGPILMGLCRVGSMMLGVSVGWWLSPVSSPSSVHWWLAAFGNGIYVVGITWAARREAEGKQNLGLPLGWTLSAVGVAMLALVAWFVPVDRPMRLNAHLEYPVALVVLALPWARRAVRSIVHPSPATIQAAVKQAILSIIFFDAMLTLQFAGPWYAIIVCSLIVPGMFLGKFFRST